MNFHLYLAGIFLDYVGSLDALRPQRRVLWVLGRQKWDFLVFNIDFKFLRSEILIAN